MLVILSAAEQAYSQAYVPTTTIMGIPIVAGGELQARLSYADLALNSLKAQIEAELKQHELAILQQYWQGLLANQAQQIAAQSSYWQGLLGLQQQQIGLEQQRWEQAIEAGQTLWDQQSSYTNQIMQMWQDTFQEIALADQEEEPATQPVSSGYGIGGSISPPPLSIDMIPSPDSPPANLMEAIPSTDIGPYTPIDWESIPE